MKPTALVVTTVHWPDDTRIRERTIRALSAEFDVRYACRAPGPTDKVDLTWVPLRGGRLRRNLAAMRVALRSGWDVMSVHDPELIPTAILSRLLRRRPVVFDVHENVPATALTRDWVPRALRRPLAALTRTALHVAEKAVTVTLAEESYGTLFRKSHVAFPNYPDTRRYPEPVEGDDSVAYLGDVTVERGAELAADAAALHGRPMRFVGRVDDELQSLLRHRAGSAVLEFTGRLPNTDALDTIRTAAVGICPLLDTPNYRDSAPTKVLEYLALGLPVVATDLPGTRRLVEGLSAVELVPPGDHHALASAIGRSADPRIRELAARQAREVRDLYQWPAQSVAAFYRSLVQ